MTKKTLLFFGLCLAFVLGMVHIDIANADGPSPLAELPYQDAGSGTAYYNDYNYLTLRVIGTVSPGGGVGYDSSQYISTVQTGNKITNLGSVDYIGKNTSAGYCSWRGSGKFFKGSSYQQTLYPVASIYYK